MTPKHGTRGLKGPSWSPTLPGRVSDSAKFTPLVPDASPSFPVVAVEEEGKPRQSEARVAAGWHGAAGWVRGVLRKVRAPHASQPILPEWRAPGTSSQRPPSDSIRPAASQSSLGPRAAWTRRWARRGRDSGGSPGAGPPRRVKLRSPAGSAALRPEGSRRRSPVVGRVEESRSPLCLPTPRPRRGRAGAELGRARGWGRLFLRTHALPEAE